MGSNGNGQPWTYDDAARMAHTLGKPVMSAAEREQQRIAYVAAVDGMATVLRETASAHGRLEARVQKSQEFASELHRRLDALESASFMARLRWLVLGR